MDWLSQNWVWVLIGIAFVCLHLFRQGHGGHGGRCHHDGRHGSDERHPLARRTERRDRTAADEV